MDRNQPVLIVHPDIEYGVRIKGMLSEMKFRVLSVAGDGDVTKPFGFSQYRICIVHESFVLPDGQPIIDALVNNTQRVPVIILSDGSDVRNAVKAIRNGAYDVIATHGDDTLLRESLARAVKITHSESPRKGAGGGESNSKRPIVTRSAKMKQMLQVALRVAPSTATVLINGESGTGKELLARFIHHHSGRQNKPFVAMNCAALPDNLAESELFGYEKGAFTGAVQSRKGRFEQANGGTLLLDEISEMPLALQVKLLRVLQEKEIDTIGGRKPTPVDVRVIASCNQDLRKLVSEGSFREDLYYRLRVIPLTIPPLRERAEDIELLVDFFVQKHTPSYQKSQPGFSSETMAQLSRWTWPGNVRELENAVERAVLICDGPVINPEHLLLDDDSPATASHTDDVLVGMTVKEMERKLIGQTLQQVNDNRTHAAKMLGISIRTLRNKLHEYEASEHVPYPSASAQ